MRQRITLFHKAKDSIDPKTIKITKDSFEVAELKAAREDRITLSLEELPVEIRLALAQSHELHVRYVSQKPYETVSPLVSRLSPGLHVFYSPERDSNNTYDLFEPLKVVLLRLLLCQTPETSFTTLPTQRFTTSAAYEYYLPHTHFDSSAFTDYVLSLCSSSNKICLSRTSLFASASTVFIDYDSIAHALTLTASWASTTFTPLQVTTPSPHNSRLEVGLLSSEPPTEPEELSLGGFLTSLGDGEDEDNKPSPTLFSFPARHHAIDSTFSTSFLTPTGLHPTLRIGVSDGRPPPVEAEAQCALHAYLKLPKVVFADKYQLQDALFMKSHNLSALHYISSPVDLEAPEYAVNAWGSSLLLELAPPSLSSSPNSPKLTVEKEKKSHNFSATIPLHLRYLKPSPSGYRAASIPQPVLFWACTADEGSKFAINPFDRVNLGYDGLFGPRTMFFHLSPEATAEPDGRSSPKTAWNEGYLDVEVPVLKLGSSADIGGWFGQETVEIGTAAVILVGFFWVLWVMLRVLRSSGYGRVKKDKLKKQNEKKKQ